MYLYIDIFIYIYISWVGPGTVARGGTGPGPGPGPGPVGPGPGAGPKPCILEVKGHCRQAKPAEPKLRLQTCKGRTRRALRGRGTGRRLLAATSNRVGYAGHVHEFAGCLSKQTGTRAVTVTYHYIMGVPEARAPRELGDRWWNQCLLGLFTMFGT